MRRIDRVNGEGDRALIENLEIVPNLRSPLDNKAATVALTKLTALALRNDVEDLGADDLRMIDGFLIAICHRDVSAYIRQLETAIIDAGVQAQLMTAHIQDITNEQTAYTDEIMNRLTSIQERLEAISAARDTGGGRLMPER